MTIGGDWLAARYIVGSEYAIGDDMKIRYGALLYGLASGSALE